MQHHRNIFTTTRPTLRERIADFALACTIAAALTVGVLAYFDVLTK